MHTEPEEPVKPSYRFEEYWRLWKDLEGPGEDDPRDPGGTTRWGIDQRSHPHVQVSTLTEEDCKSILYGDWLKQCVALMPFPEGEIAFDTGQNQGNAVRDHVMLFQISWQSMLNVREEHYYATARRFPALKVYLHGWLNRCDKMRAWILAHYDVKG